MARLLVIMAKAYTVTSDPFYVNGNLTESAANTYTETEISLPLDSLNREGVIVHAVYFIGDEPDAVAATRTFITMQLTSTSKTSMVGANDANLLARRETILQGGAAEFSGPHHIDFIGEQGPYSESDNLGLIATDNVFFAVRGANNAAAKSGTFRMVCSRIKLSADAYAALVTNELSS